MELTERIEHMEKLLDESKEAIDSLSAALETYLKTTEKLQELTEYYESGQWLADLDEDRKGNVPSEIKKGVLSQDAVYDLLTENAELLQLLKFNFKDI